MTKIITFVCFVLLCVSVSAEPIIPVRTCGTVLDAPGGKYKLVRNLTCSNPIVITANDVDFNLSNRTLSGNGGDLPAIRIDSGVIGARVYNGNLNGFRSGIFAFSASEIEIRSVTITNCELGIALSGTSDAIIENNTITSISEVGILAIPNDFTGADNNRIAGNVIVGGFEGVVSRSTSGTQILNNVISDATELGISVSLGTSHSIEGNVISRSGLVGIQISTSNGLQINNNISNDSGIYGIALGNNLAEDPNDSNTIQGNTTNRNGSIGLFILIGTGNTVQGNTSMDNDELDMADNFPCENIWSGNFFVTDDEGDGPGAGCIQ
jgi:parallel beta-helix repeat protein